MVKQKPEKPCEQEDRHFTQRMAKNSPFVESNALTSLSQPFSGESQRGDGVG